MRSGLRPAGTAVQEWQFCRDSARSRQRTSFSKREKSMNRPKALHVPAGRGDQDTPRWPCLHATRTGCTLDVLVAPNAKRTACMGLHGDALRIRLAAPPVDGAANEALLRWVAGQLGLARSVVVLARGDASKRKQLAIDMAFGDVEAWLTMLLKNSSTS